MFMSMILMLGSASAAGGCFQTAKPLEPGALVRRIDVTKSPCRVEQKAPLRYDRLVRGMRAAEAIPAGSYLGRLAPSPFAIDRGQPMRLVIAVGPVLIERALRAALPARAGGRVHALDADGKAVTMPLAATDGANR